MRTSTRLDFETIRIDHSGIVVGICHEIGLIEALDHPVVGSEPKVNCGAAAHALMLNGLGFAGRCT